jgi:hypothetical protein
MTGIEPAHLAVLDPKSSASASSATSPKSIEQALVVKENRIKEFPLVG